MLAMLGITIQFVLTFGCIRHHDFAPLIFEIIVVWGIAAVSLLRSGSPPRVG